MPKRTFLLLSVPDDFGEKLLGFIHNLNALNNDRKPPIELEEYYQKEVDDDDSVDEGDNQGGDAVVAIPKSEGETPTTNNSS